MPELVARECSQLGHVALRRKGCALAREIAQEGEHLRGRARHLGHQRHLGVARVAEQRGRLATQLERCASMHGAVVPFGLPNSLARVA